MELMIMQRQLSLAQQQSAAAQQLQQAEHSQVRPQSQHLPGVAWHLLQSETLSGRCVALLCF